MVDLLRNVPLGTYLESPETWLHRLDSRVKFAWLTTVLLCPILGNGAWRVAVVTFLVAISWLSCLPWRVWRRQLALTLVLSLFALVLTAFAPDAIGLQSEPVRPSSDRPAYGLLYEFSAPSSASDPLEEAQAEPAETSASSASSPQALEPNSTSLDPNLAPDIDRLLATDWSQLPQPTSYRYKLLILPEFLGKQLTVSRRSLAVAIRLGTLIFTLLYSTALFLLTTAPEEITEAMAFFCSLTACST